MATQKKKEFALHSSAAEYLTFVAATGESDVSFEMRYEDENIWLTQKMMAALYDVGLPTINEHIKKIYADGELTEAATIRKFRIVQTEGVRQVNREMAHFNLQMIICSGTSASSVLAFRVLRVRASGQTFGRMPSSNMILKVMAPVTGTLNSKS